MVNGTTPFTQGQSLHENIFALGYLWMSPKCICRFIYYLWQDLS